MPSKNRSKKRYSIPTTTQLRLWIKAGGRCEFNGCNEYLLRDRLTLSETNYSDIAHIVAASSIGPRGDDPLPADQRNKIGNLMLVCKNHHKLIDDKNFEEEYPKEKLLRFKEEHETRIFRLTSIQPDNKTTIVRLRSNIGCDSVAITRGQIYEAIEPRYPVDDKGIEIDLTTLPGTDTPAYWEAGRECILDKTKHLLSPGISSYPVEHISVFALGPIPFLIFLGTCLGNKIPMEVYQKHRDSDTWVWKKYGKLARYEIVECSKGNDLSKVALLLSLSGKIDTNDLPKSVRETYTIYEITLNGQEPNPMFLRKRKDLVAFKKIYQLFLRRVRVSHPKLKQILLFPAVPVSVAVLCGSERLPKVDPCFVVYDFDGLQGKFNKSLRVG